MPLQCTLLNMEMGYVSHWKTTWTYSLSWLKYVTLLRTGARMRGIMVYHSNIILVEICIFRKAYNKLLWRWFIPDDVEKIEENLLPTKKGIGVTISEWEIFSMEAVKYLQTIEAIKNGIPCSLSESHQNQMGMLMCRHCNPNDCSNW